MDDKLLYKIGLSIIPGIGGILARNLVSYVGSVEDVFSESLKSLQKIPGIGEVNAHRIKDKNVLLKAEKELQFVTKHEIEVLFYTDKNFPRRLKTCVDAPVILYTRGNLDLDEKRIVSIVGTRNASNYGKQICEELIQKLSERNYKTLIVSGLAYGIDIHAHKSALKYNLPTVGVIAHGLDKMYPSLHA